MANLLGSDVDSCVLKTIEAVDTIRRGILDQNQMREAHMVIEALNSNPNVDSTLPIAYKLITFSGNEDLTQSVKHFGLQLVENCIKYKWNEISNPTKDEIKAVLQKMICETLVGKDLKLIKEGISKCVVEVMKREWPGNWSHLMGFMLSLKLNDRVLFIIGRLSEELGIFYSPANRDRRRDMTIELKANYPAILNYIGECLVSGDCDLCSAALRTLSPFLEWHTFDESLLIFLCDILAMDIDPARDREQIFIKTQTTDCLLTCLFRKGSKKDRIGIMDLFCPKNVTSIFKCIDMVIPKISVNNFFNDHFTLAKRVFSVVTMMGQTAIQLHSVKQLPMETWQIYIQKMHSLFCIDNYILNAFVLQFWRDLAKIKELQSLITESLLTSLLLMIPEKLFKRPFGDPSIPMEFDDEEDYDVFYIKFKAELTDLMRSLTLHYQNGSPLLDVLLKSDERDFQVETLCGQISCLSALTIFIPHSLTLDPNSIDALLKRMFKMAGYELPGKNSNHRSNSVRNLRRYTWPYSSK